jgi:hypothetical protein
MQIAYFAHSYRPVDTYVVDHFAKLMRSEAITPSLDPPSNRVNGAKLERHLNASDGMVAVLTVRDGGVSPYILYEINLCRRARKPLLVFVEDQLPSNLLPSRVLQYRFTRGSLLRQVREHRHALHIFKQYVGTDPPPKYQPSALRQSCIILGNSRVNDKECRALCSQLEANGYTPVILEESARAQPADELLETIMCADLAIYGVDDLTPQVQYLAGVVRTALIPTIPITHQTSYPYDSVIPREYQPKLALPDHLPALEELIREEISICREDFLDLDNQTEVAKYADMLFGMRVAPESYSPTIRNLIIDTVNMRDQYNIKHAVGVGPGAQIIQSPITQNSTDSDGGVYVAQLAAALTELRLALVKDQTGDPDQLIDLGRVATAEKAATEGDGNHALESLKQAGAWVWDTATKIGVGIAIQAAKAGLGL